MEPVADDPAKIWFGRVLQGVPDERIGRSRTGRKSNSQRRLKRRPLAGHDEEKSNKVSPM